MPSKLFLRGDSDAIWLQNAPDVIAEHVEMNGAAHRFLRLEMVPAGPDEPSRPVYIDPTQVAAVAPLDEREIQAEYADLPDWLER